jgi:hypothetical protein
MTTNANRYFALSSFFVLDEHQLALVKISTAQIARFQRLRDRLAEVQAEDETVERFVTRDPGCVLWLPWDEAMGEREEEEITAAEWDVQVKTRPEEYEDPEFAYVCVTVHGIHFSCVTETDEGHTGTIEWATLEKETGK